MQMRTVRTTTVWKHCRRLLSLRPLRTVCSVLRRRCEGVPVQATSFRVGGGLRRLA
jgi:hypothetical protein